MPKLVPPRLRRFLAFALPVCASSLIAQRLVLAQRPQNALPPPARGPAPTDEYYRGEAPYPTATPSTAPTATPTPDVYTPRQPSRPQNVGPIPSGTPQSAGAGDSALAAFLSSAAGGPPLKLSQARAGWKSMRIVRGGVTSGREGSAPRLSAPGSSGVLWSTIVERFAGEPGVFLTRGRTINLNGDDHLLVYQAQFPGAAETTRWLNSQFPGNSPGRTAPSLSEVTRSMRSFLAAIPLRASLINTRQVAAMEDIEPFDFQNRFNSLTRDLEEGFRQFQSRPSTGGTAPGTSPETDNLGPDPSGSQIVPPARIPTTPTAPSTPPRVIDETPRAVPVPDAVAQQAASEPLRRLFAAVQRYRADNGDVLPPMDDLTNVQAALSAYLDGDESWRDPVSGRFFVPNARLSTRRMVHLKPFAASLILFYSEPDVSGKRTVLRLDGIIRRVSPSEWDKLNGTAGVQ